MRHVRALLACAVALSAAACARTPTTPEPASFEGSWLGSGNYSAPSSPSYNAGIMFGGGHRDGTSTTTTSTTSSSDSTTVTGNRGNYFGSGN